MYYGARWYDSSLGRFLSADTIIPQPGDPQAWDRFAYALNNPVLFTDPSGHCSGNPTNPKNPDRKCWKKYFEIRKTYRNVYLNGGDWTLEQLNYILKSLNLVRNAFGGQQGFVNGLGNFSIVKKELFGFALGMAPPGSNEIWLDEDMYKQEKILDIYHGIVHEIGHIFDFKGSHGNPDYYKSRFFVNIYAPQCNTGWLGCVSSTYPNPSLNLNFGGDGYGWVLGAPNTTTRYGNQASIEDFADSFAAYVMSYGTENQLTDREKLIALWIDLAK